MYLLFSTSEHDFCSKNFRNHLRWMNTILSYSTSLLPKFIDLKRIIFKFYSIKTRELQHLELGSSACIISTCSSDKQWSYMQSTLSLVKTFVKNQQGFNQDHDSNLEAPAVRDEKSPAAGPGSMSPIVDMPLNLLTWLSEESIDPHRDVLSPNLLPT